MKIDLAGKVALVTGASGELGRVITRTLAECGADVVIHYNTSADRAAALQKEVQAMGRRSCIVQADVTRQEHVLRMRDEAVKRLGAPDIIVNNAVIQFAWTSVLEQSAEAFRSQFESCTLHNVFMTQAFVPAMIAKKWGRVIAINTECSLQCFPTQAAYSGGKRGMDGVLRVLAKEIGEHQITVNQVAPGWTISDRDRANHTEVQPDHDKNVPLRHRGTDQDIANAVAFLASDLAQFISGAYIPVCGGNVMPAI
jgi:3-oxoacyl-[acyl-carrier protein] reductase